MTKQNKSKNISLKALKNINERFKKNLLPKYNAPFFNFVNTYKGSKTKPQNVGRLTDLFREYRENCRNTDTKVTISGWQKYYLNKTIEVGNVNNKELKTGKEIINQTIKTLKNNILFLQNEILPNIDEKNIRIWVEDLIFTKTFNGLFMDRAIAIFVLENIIFEDKTKYEDDKLRVSTNEEESQDIDYVYEINKSNIIKLQIKTGDMSIGAIRKKQSHMEDKSDIYYCFFDTSKKTLMVKKNSTLIKELLIEDDIY